MVIDTCSDSNPAQREPSATARPGRIAAFCGLLLTMGLAATPAAQSQSAAGTTSSVTPSPSDSAFTWHGITLYGIIDVGLQYDTHAAPFNDYFPGGSNDIVQKDSRRAIWGVTPSNLSQSRVGLNGNEPLGLMDWSAIFKLETFINPQSGTISDALKSLTQNNGRALANQTTNLDSSAAGQVFQQSYGGLSSPTFGTFTFGRQNTSLADGIAKYDPNAASQAFSLIGLSGTTAGGGDTQDRRVDNSIKYVLGYHGGHAGALYKFGNYGNGAYSVYQFTVGGEFAGLSVDAYYSKVKDAVAAASLTAAQVATLPTLGFASDKSLAGTVTDNTTWALLALYAVGPLKFYASYENIKYENPRTPLPVGFDDIGGYTLAVVNNTSLPHEKILQVYWGGVKYSWNNAVDFTAAYYGYHQSSFASGANTHCTTIVSGQCRGELRTLSFDVIYKLSKHFDTYAGAMWTDVADGLANGYIYSKNNINPTIGLRFRF